MMAISKKIFRDVTAPVSVIKSPEKVMQVKSAPIPMSVFACSFVYFIINKSITAIECSSNFFSKDTPDTIGLFPVVQISHEKSRRSPKNCLLEYVVVTVFLRKNKQHHATLSKLALVLDVKLHVITQETIVINKDLIKVIFRGHIKTYVIGELVDNFVITNDND